MKKSEFLESVQNIAEAYEFDLLRRHFTEMPLIKNIMVGNGSEVHIPVSRVLGGVDGELVITFRPTK